MKSFATLFISPLPPLPSLFLLPLPSPPSPLYLSFLFLNIFLKITLLQSTHKKKKPHSQIKLANETHTCSQTLHFSELLYTWNDPSEAAGLDFHSQLHFHALVHHKEGVGRVITTKTHLFPLPGLICHFGCTPSFIIYC